ncbi:MAG: hypothetical protein WCG25_05240 [bacterium]
MIYFEKIDLEIYCSIFIQSAQSQSIHEAYSKNIALSDAFNSSTTFIIVSLLLLCFNTKIYHHQSFQVTIGQSQISSLYIFLYLSKIFFT